MLEEWNGMRQDWHICIQANNTFNVNGYGEIVALRMTNTSQLCHRRGYHFRCNRRSCTHYHIIIMWRWRYSKSIWIGIKQASWLLGTSSLSKLKQFTTVVFTALVCFLLHVVFRMPPFYLHLLEDHVKLICSNSETFLFNQPHHEVL